MSWQERYLDMAIINVPAPAGSQYAYQSQMQAMAGLGRALGAYLGQRRVGQDIQNIMNWDAQQQARQETPWLEGGVSDLPAHLGPIMSSLHPFPDLQSQMGQQGMMQGLMGNIFGQQGDRNYPRIAENYFRSADLAMNEYAWLQDAAYKETDPKRKQELEKQAQRAFDSSMSYRKEGARYLDLSGKPYPHKPKIPTRTPKAIGPTGETIFEGETEEQTRTRLGIKGYKPPGAEPFKMPKAPRPWLAPYWDKLSDKDKDLVRRAVLKGATKAQVLAALRARGAIK